MKNQPRSHSSATQRSGANQVTGSPRAASQRTPATNAPV